jgi:hypothetical protein
MIMSYTLLVFEPDIKHHPSAENVLWKGQVIPPSNYSSIMLILLQDILELNNRRTMQEWEKILRENSFNYELNYDHEFCREYIIEDKPLVAYSFQLFMCDLQDGLNRLEVADENILPILFSLNISKNKQEPIQVARYFPGQFYKAHYDSFDEETETGKTCIGNSGQRVATVLIYLNQPSSGGGTNFPHAGIRVKPKKGTAIIFFPCTVDGKMDPYTLHSAEDAIDEKWVSQIWIRQGIYK